MGNEAPHGVVIILADPLHGERGVPWPNAAVLVSQLVTQVYQCHVTLEKITLALYRGLRKTAKNCFEILKTGIE